MAATQSVRHFLLESYKRPLVRKAGNNTGAKRKTRNRNHSITLDGNWEVFHSDEDDTLSLTLINEVHLLISNKTITLESYFLLDKNLILNGIVLNDSLILMENKRNKPLKQFQIQFKGDDAKGKSSISFCTDFVSITSNYITINSMENRYPVDQVASLPLTQCHNGFVNKSMLLDNNCLMMEPSLTSGISSSQVQQPYNNYSNSNREVFVDSSNFPMVKDIVSNLLNRVPVTNDNLSDFMNPDGKALIDKHIKNLLLDDNFPAFVQLIERELKELTDYH